MYREIGKNILKDKFNKLDKVNKPREDWEKWA
jgi:hypothetical protein